MTRVIPPGELAARIESAMWDAPNSDDPGQAKEDLKQFLLDNAPSIVLYLRVAANNEWPSESARHIEVDIQTAKWVETGKGNIGKAKVVKDG